MRFAHPPETAPYQFSAHNRASGWRLASLSPVQQAFHPCAFSETPSVHLSKMFEWESGYWRAQTPAKAGVRFQQMEMVRHRAAGPLPGRRGAGSVTRCFLLRHVSILRIREMKSTIYGGLIAKPEPQSISDYSGRECKKVINLPRPNAYLMPPQRSTWAGLRSAISVGEKGQSREIHKRQDASRRFGQK
jgi:hypothetical protein